jgi:hypothetical protein
LSIEGNYRPPERSGGQSEFPKFSTFQRAFSSEAAGLGKMALGHLGLAILIFIAVYYAARPYDCGRV